MWLIHPLLPSWVPSRVCAEGTVWVLIAELLVAVPEQVPGAIHPSLSKGWVPAELENLTCTPRRC